MQTQTRSQNTLFSPCFDYQALIISTCGRSADPYQVYTERTFDAFYRLSEPGVQIRAHVEDIVRSKVTRPDSPQIFSHLSYVIIDVCIKVVVV